MAVITVSDNNIKMTADEDEWLERIHVTSFRFYAGSGGGAISVESKIVSWNDKGVKTVIASGSGQKVLDATIADAVPLDIIGEGWYDGLRITSLSGTGAYLLIQVD